VKTIRDLCEIREFVFGGAPATEGGPRVQLSILAPFSAFFAFFRG
jgi:hypothetical protein